MVFKNNPKTQLGLELGSNESNEALELLAQEPIA